MKKMLLVILYLITINITKADEIKIYTLSSTDESSGLYISCFKNYSTQNETCLDTDRLPLSGKIRIYDEKIDKIEKEITFEKGKVITTTSYQHTNRHGNPFPITKHTYKYKDDKKIMYELYQGTKLKIRIINQENDLIAHYYYSNVHISLNIETIYSTHKTSSFDGTDYIPKTDFSLFYILPKGPETIHVSDGKYNLSSSVKLIATYQIKNKKLDGLFTTYTENGEKNMEVMYKKGKAVSGYRYKNGNKTQMTPVHLYRINENSLLLKILDDVPL